MIVLKVRKSEKETVVSFNSFTSLIVSAAFFKSMLLRMTNIKFGCLFQLLKQNSIIILLDGHAVV